MTVAPTTRRRFLAAAATLPAVGAAPFVFDRVRPAQSADEPKIRLTSNDGRRQAWAPHSPPRSIHEPGGRTESTIIVRDQLTDETRSMTLQRNLEPEAFSPDGQTLFAIDIDPPPRRWPTGSARSMSRAARPPRPSGR